MRILMQLRKSYQSESCIVKIEYKFIWPGIIEVRVNGTIVYTGTDWKVAQLSVVPF